MIKKLIVVAMLIATLGIGMVVHAQATGGSTGKQLGTGRKRHTTHYGRHHRRHRRGGNTQGRRGPKKN